MSTRVEGTLADLYLELAMSAQQRAADTEDNANRLLSKSQHRAITADEAQEWAIQGRHEQLRANQFGIQGALLMLVHFAAKRDAREEEEYESRHSRRRD